MEGSRWCSEPPEAEVYAPVSSGAFTFERDSPTPATPDGIFALLHAVRSRTGPSNTFADRSNGLGLPHGARIFGQFAQPDGVCSMHWCVALRAEIHLRGAGNDIHKIADQLSHPSNFYAAALLTIDAGLAPTEWFAKRRASAGAGVGAGTSAVAGAKPRKTATPTAAALRELAIETFGLHVLGRVCDSFRSTTDLKLDELATLLKRGFASAPPLSRPQAVAWLRFVIAFDSALLQRLRPVRMTAKAEAPSVALSKALLNVVEKAVDVAANAPARATRAPSTAKKAKKAGAGAVGGAGAGAGAGVGAEDDGGDGGSCCVGSNDDEEDGYGGGGKKRASAILPKEVGVPLASTLAGLVFMESGDNTHGYIPRCDDGAPWRDVRNKLARLGWGYMGAVALPAMALRVAACVRHNPPFPPPPVSHQQQGTGSTAIQTVFALMTTNERRRRLSCPAASCHLGRARARRRSSSPK